MTFTVLTNCTLWSWGKTWPPLNCRLTSWWTCSRWRLRALSGRYNISEFPKTGTIFQLWTHKHHNQRKWAWSSRLWELPRQSRKKPRKMIWGKDGIRKLIKAQFLILALAAKERAETASKRNASEACKQAISLFSRSPHTPKRACSQAARNGKFRAPCLDHHSPDPEPLTIEIWWKIS